jgi:hypothetical protein
VPLRWAGLRVTPDGSRRTAKVGGLRVTPDGSRRAAKVGGVARDTGRIAPCR